jgi:hypothetical protein
MNTIIRRLRGLSDDQLHAVSQAVDLELERRTERHRQRGFTRSTFMVDLVRGKRLAPRYRAAA